MTLSKKLARALPNNSMLFVCDMQDKFRDTIAYFPQIVTSSARLLQAAKLLQVPAIVTEQYPKGLGHTVSDLDVKGLPVFSKTNFCMLQPPVEEYMKQFQDISNIIICGIEAHVCVKATTYELLKRGFAVHLVVDAISSRSMTDRLFAFKAMQDGGAQLATSESVILGLVEDSTHPKFREIQKVIWNSAPDSGLIGSAV